MLAQGTKGTAAGPAWQACSRCRHRQWGARSVALQLQPPADGLQPTERGHFVSPARIATTMRFGQLLHPTPLASAMMRGCRPFAIQQQQQQRLTPLASAMMRGCRPSAMYRSACFISSPISTTMVVVPSLKKKKTWVAGRRASARQTQGGHGAELTRTTWVALPSLHTCTAHERRHQDQRHNSSTLHQPSLLINKPPRTR